jgi:hypothetical protein
MLSFPTRSDPSSSLRLLLDPCLVLTLPVPEIGAEFFGDRAPLNRPLASWAERAKIAG